MLNLRVVRWQAFEITGTRDLVVSCLWGMGFSFVLYGSFPHVLRKWLFTKPLATQGRRCSPGPNPEFPGGKEWLAQLGPVVCPDIPHERLDWGDGVNARIRQNLQELYELIGRRQVARKKGNGQRDRMKGVLIHCNLKRTAAEDTLKKEQWDLERSG